MPFISQEELITGLPNATPEQVLLINWFYATFNDRSAPNRTIVNVEPLFYQGLLAGTEFLTYAANKVYLTLEVNHTGPILATTVIMMAVYYDMANAIFYYNTNASAYYDPAAPGPRALGNGLTTTNLYFSRLTSSQYTAIKFSGYRITLV